MLAKPNTRHRGTRWALVDGAPPSELFDRYPPSRTAISLTESREAVRRARQAADTFHVYETTCLNGSLVHVVYARYKLVTYIFEIANDAVLAAFGLAIRPTPSVAAN
ncbi:hypothetical protein ACIRJM_22955 [Streptomyces sp. NPDC102405]|uniref:hypothetical protein n=1 Tax=Streptomyces sp. NPDC102405 TaxID=3366170 RepID=UPI0038191FB0